MSAEQASRSPPNMEQASTQHLMHLRAKESMLKAESRKALQEIRLAEAAVQKAEAPGQLPNTAFHVYRTQASDSLSCEAIARQCTLSKTGVQKLL